MKPLLPDLGLLKTQRWMQAFIQAGGDDEAALRAPQVAAEIPAGDALNMVLPSATLTALERVGIYRGMYLARLQEALRTDYPGLLYYLGQEDFASLVERYVDAYPSRSYTLNRLGDHLPRFIAEDSGLPECEFLHDLARLELALTEVFDAEQSPVLTVQAIASVREGAWEAAQLVPTLAFRLLAFRYPVSEYLGAVDGENPFSRVRRKQTWVAAYRKNGSVHRLDLNRRQFDLLAALASGMAVGPAVEQSKVREEQLFAWFRDWTAEGLFQSVALP